MRISTIGYVGKQGVKNIGRNKMFSAASIATMSACIFLFGLFFSIIMNFQYIIKSAEEGVAITVLFEEDATDEQIKEIGEQLKSRDDVSEVKYVSADEAWDRFQKDYFKGNEELAEGFKDDNPLAGSDNYEVYMKVLDEQDDVNIISKSRSLSKTQEVTCKICKRAGRCTSSQQIRCCGEYIVECERIGRLCIDRDHFDPVGRIDLPDQQYGHDGYHGQKRRNRDHEVYRSQGLCRAVAVCDRRSDHGIIRSGDPAGTFVCALRKSGRIYSGAVQYLE